MIIPATEKVPLEKCPALVLNADFRPLSYYPLSLWCWQDTVKAVFLERVNIIENYNEEESRLEKNFILSLARSLQKLKSTSFKFFLHYHEI